MRFITIVGRSLIKPETSLFTSLAGCNIKLFTREISAKRRKMENKPNYDVVLSQESLDMIVSYKNDLFASKAKPGTYLKKVLDARKSLLDQTSAEKFVEYMLLTKKPKVYATEEIRVDGTDWNETEFQILGDLNIAMNVEIYDNGVWDPNEPAFRVHNPPLNGALLFTNGPLLRSRSVVGMTPDLKQIISGDDIDQDKYNRLVERRLVPLLCYANENSKKDNQRALVTIPGLGCGVFAGKFLGQMGQHLNQALQNILKKHAKNYDNIACIYFDPHRECTNETQQFDRVSYRVRPASQNNGRSQLCKPNEYEEDGDDFSDCKLHKVVAWDHLAFPGNSYFVEHRWTDDGVVGAATNSMRVITGSKGIYDNGDYFPPEGYENWKEVVDKNQIILRAKDNVKVATADGLLIDLKE
ncbi:uncharacterized protein LOC129575260 [Sitodiplosis mosellana]|uniref:uncharacterized protein LOC129575260 n=1 Tax=Sitodiplosis mosellana TaxID=263140 RepID=UPI002444CA64|nr:uncharacterized protein LOC129575260 [Sitodiplosis mosellana]XP_055314415.1 uncharacterized protein LOC129575260 [Sitodiplosis mosellana]XP_055314416.1 uncharacterized protein LOC129575260 [Sitodiplosis mosellana]XP_055314417.1 uncharacterized protein LOC129575260 [Sitodiplosis mosellana]